MTKTELIKAVRENYEFGEKVKKADIENAVEAVFEVITETLAKGEDVRIIGFGNFAVTERAARTGRNPQTGESIEIPASKTPKFKPGKALKDAVK